MTVLIKSEIGKEADQPFFLDKDDREKRQFYHWLRARSGINLLCSCGKPAARVFKVPEEDFWVSSCKKCLKYFVETFQVAHRLQFKSCQRGKCGALATRVIVQKNERGIRLTLCELHTFEFKNRVSVNIHFDSRTIYPAI